MVALKAILASVLAAVGHIHDAGRMQIILGSYDSTSLGRFAGINGPYIPVKNTAISEKTPKGCSVSNVYMLAKNFEHRPSSNEYHDFQEVITKIKRAKPGGELAFFRNYTSFNDTHSHQKLTILGTKTAKLLGARMRLKYTDLPLQQASVLMVHQDNINSTRTFLDAFNNNEDWKKRTKLSVLSEDRSPEEGCLKYLLNAAEYQGEHFKERAELLSSRFSSQLLDGATTVTESDIDSMMNMCAYELSSGKSESMICELFDPDDWLSWSHNEDLRTYYSYGPGNSLSAVIGTPYVNSTLQFFDTDVAPFYFQWAATNDLAAYLSLLGTFNEPPRENLYAGVYWRIADLFPMGGHIVAEKMKCGGHGTAYVRLIVNDQVLPIPNCQDGPGHSCMYSTFKEQVGQNFLSKSSCE